MRVITTIISKKRDLNKSLYKRLQMKSLEGEISAARYQYYIEKEEEKPLLYTRFISAYNLGIDKIITVIAELPSIRYGTQIRKQTNKKRGLFDNNRTLSSAKIRI